MAKLFWSGKQQYYYQITLLTYWNIFHSLAEVGRNTDGGREVLKKLSISSVVNIKIYRNPSFE